MSISTDLTRLQSAKAAMKTAIQNKGVAVADGAKLDAFAALIDSIEAGDGGKAYKIVSGYLTSTSTDTDGSFTLSHNLGCTPILFIMARPASYSFKSGAIGFVLYGNPDVEESLAPAFSREIANKEFQAIVRSAESSVFAVSLNGTVDNNAVSFGQYKNGNSIAKVTGAYLWLAVGAEGGTS